MAADRRVITDEHRIRRRAAHERAARAHERCATKADATAAFMDQCCRTDSAALHRQRAFDERGRAGHEWDIAESYRTPGGSLVELLIDVGPDLAQLHALRARLRAELAPHVGMALGDVELICSELASNAISQTEAAVQVRVGVDEGTARIEVEDSDPLLPVADIWAAAVGHDFIYWALRSIAARWDWTPTVAGKVVWVELTLVTAST